MFYCVFVTFPYGVLGQVWYLFVSIPDLCLHSYFKSCLRHYIVIYVTFSTIPYRSNVIAIPKSPSQFENRIVAQVYIRSITRSTMYQNNSILLAGSDVWKISSVAFG